MTTEKTLMVSLNISMENQTNAVEVIEALSRVALGLANEDIRISINVMLMDTEVIENNI